MMKKIIILPFVLICAFNAMACRDVMDERNSMESSTQSSSVTSTEEVNVSFLSLQEAFDGGDVLYSDLMEMSNLLNNNASISLDFANQEVIRAIKRAYGELNAVEVENVEVEYYGEYNGNYAVTIYGKDDNFATVITEVKIADVTFCYPVGGLEIVVCKIQN